MVPQGEVDMQHLDEGTIHAWLDGQLPPEEAAAVDAHVAECGPCADAVAEARGLIAASSRILMSLDSVPRDVAPKSATPVVPAVQIPEVATAARSAEPNDVVAITTRVARPTRPVRRWLRGPSLAAAATVVVAVGLFTLTRNRGVETFSSALDTERAPMSGPAVVDSSALPTVASAPVPAPVAPPAASNLAPVQESTRARREAFADKPTALPPSPVVASDEMLKRAKVAEAKSTKEPKDIARARVLIDSTAERPQVALQASIAPVKPDSVNALVARAPGATVSARSASAISADRREVDSASRAGTGVIAGRATDGNGTGLANVLVQVAGTSIGVTTSSEGTYRLSGVTAGAHRLTMRRIGFEMLTRDVTVTARETVTADAVLKPVAVALENVVVTGTASTQQRSSLGNSVTRVDAAPGAPVTALQSNAIGCYEMSITPSAAQARSNFRQTPRRVALDGEIVPSNADGVWYRARDLARVSPVPNGLWRPVGTDGLELEWVYATFTARIRLTGPVTSMMRGTAEELNRAQGTGESGSVVSIKSTCPQ